MRKLLLQVQVSVDGFIASANGGTDWLVWDWGDEWQWDDELKRYFDDVLGTIDCILLSRKMAEGGFISHWEGAAREPTDSRFTYARKLNDMRRVVFTKTLDRSEWTNTILARGDLVSEINDLKNQDGKDIIVYGGGTLVSALIKEELVDQFQLFVNPTILGRGMSIFADVVDARSLTLTEARAFDCGIAVLNYEPTRTGSARG